MTSRWDDEYRGNPTRQLGSYPTPPMPTKKVRALTGDYFLNGQVAEKGNTYTVAADDAYILVAQKRAEYVK
jgi:hypothetical protein